MATTKHQTDTADFIGNLAVILADRKESVRSEFNILLSNVREGQTLLANLRIHIETLKSLPANSEFLPTYDKFLKEAEEREAELTTRLEQSEQRLELLKSEFKVLNALTAKETK